MNNKYFIKRGKNFFLFFFLITNLYANNDSLIKDISSSHKWKALLHIRDNEPKIDNKTFLLSYGKFSLENELKHTIKSFKNGENICRFPARYLFLKNRIKNNDFKIKECKDFENYIKQTNPKDLDLVFTAENVTSPSSMMGHIFFKLNSKKINNKTRKNAVSFFTVIDTFNIPLLITKSTITGMKGYFILSPYEKQIFKYLYEENRSIWEYKLNLSENDKKLILFHFWELKDIDITYFFTGFNCATMIDDILSITKDNYTKNSLWITPKDVVKNAKRNKIISSVKMLPSVQWELSMLSENLSDDNVNEIIEILNNKQYKKIKKFNFHVDNKIRSLEKHFMLTYAKYLYINEDVISYEEFRKIRSFIDKQSQYLIDIKDYKNPINTYDDSHMSIQYGKSEDRKFIGLNFLAASNTLYDDNREYFSENSLKIGEINIRREKNKTYLNSFDIYNMKLLIPWSNITKTFSKEFKVNYEKHKSNSLKDVNVLNVSGGVGLSNKLTNDVIFYNLLKAGFGLNFNKQYPYGSFESGIIIYELFNMKTVLFHEFIYNQNNSDNTYSNLVINQSKYFDNKNYKVDINYNRKTNTSYANKAFTFNLTYFF